MLEAVGVAIGHRWRKLPPIQSTPQLHSGVFAFMYGCVYICIDADILFIIVCMFVCVCVSDDSAAILLNLPVSPHDSSDSSSSYVSDTHTCTHSTRATHTQTHTQQEIKYAEQGYEPTLGDLYPDGHDMDNEVSVREGERESVYISVLVYACEVYI